MGVCKLTGKTGEFVESHLIPKALTRPSIRGEPLIESGEGRRPKRVWSSWKDNQLVVQEGENILSALDDWAIREMRRHKLIWSAWGSARSLGNLHKPIPKTEYGFRNVVISEPTRLRLFFLSLLWRAAATSRPEFGDIELPADHLEQLRQMVLNGNPFPLSFYPIGLVQLSTLGPVHNQTPIATTKMRPSQTEVGEVQEEIPLFRFYFDGLIAHVDRRVDDSYARKLGPMLIGAEAKLALMTITFEESFQRRAVEAIVQESNKNWRSLIARLS